VQADMDVYEYDITVTPEKGRKAKMQMLEALCENREWGAFASDGRRLWIPREEDTTVFDLELPSEDGAPGQEVKVELKETRSFKLHSSEAGQLMNVIARQAMHEVGMTMGPSHRVYEADNEPIILDRWGVSLTKGVKTSVVKVSGGMMINVDSCVKIRQTASLLDLLNKKGRKYFEKEILGKTVEASYAERFFVVEGVMWDMTPLTTFSCRGVDKTFEQYVKDRYSNYWSTRMEDHIDPKQPMIAVRNKFERRDRRVGGDTPSSKHSEDTTASPRTTNEIIYLIPQLCSLTDFPDDVKTNFNARKDIDQYTKLTGKKRANEVQHFIDQLAQADIFSKWNIRLFVQMEAVQAVIGGDNHLLMGDGDVKVSKDRANFGASVRDHPVFRAVDLDNWLVVHHSNCSANDIDYLVQHLIREGRRVKINIRSPKKYDIGHVDARNRGYARVYSDAMKRCPAIGDKTLQIVLVVIPGGPKNDAEYGKLKEFIEGTCRLKCQFVQDKNLNQKNSKRLNDVLGGVLTQMNWKLGGATWAVQLEIQDTCLVGIDVSHRPGHAGASILAIAIGIDPNASRFHTEFFPQSPGQERMDNVETSIERGLLEYQRTTGTRPKRILVFRDGVGDGQFKDVERNEVPQYHNACAKVFGADYRYEFYMVICSKDTNARIFDLSQNNGNAPAGTMVKDVIIPEGRNEFFVIPHTATEGGAMPTRFSVLQSQGALTIPQLAQTARALCVGYYNYPGAIRVPVPVQLAHVMSKHMAVSYNQSGTLSEQELGKVVERYAQLSMGGSAWYV